MKKLLLLMSLFLVVCPASAQEKSAELYMQNLGDRVVDILSNKDLDNEKIHSLLRDVIEDNFALNAMGQFALGKYWRNSTDQEKEEFQRLFRLSVVDHYIQRFETHTNERFDITGSRKEKDGAVVVSSDIIRPSGPPLRLAWRLYSKDGRFKVYDVLIDGISMSNTQRSEYSAVIQKEGGSVTALNQVMRAKWHPSES